MSDSPVLYSLTLQRPSSISASVGGQFIEGTKAQQIVLARGSWLELLRPDLDSGKLVLVHRVNVMATVRSLATFKIAAAGHNYLLMTTDSGRLSVLTYNSKENQFFALKNEPFGKSGIRRTIPGELLACDPKGRAAMVGAIEKGKLVYVLNRSEDGTLSVSSPLENTAINSICYDLVGLDVGYENPTFAALEGSYAEGSQPAAKRLVLYELDLGLNHIVRKWTMPLEFSAGLLIALPGGIDGPSGVLVCFDGFIQYFHPGQDSVLLKLPHVPDNDTNYIVSSVTHKLNGSFFVLLQDRSGTLFKLSFVLPDDEFTARWGGRKALAKMELQQFGACPPSSFLSIFKAGFLFCAVDSGNHLLYQFNTLGEDDDVPIYSSESEETKTYEPLQLENITVVDELPSLNATSSSAVLNVRKDETPQIYAVSGTGEYSFFNAVQYGIEVSELISSPLPAQPLAVFTTKTQYSDEYDKYIVLSFANETLVLSIGDEVTEVSDSGLVKNVSTLAVQQVGLSSLVQVHANGLVHISKDSNVTEWKPPSQSTILMCAANNTQVILALSTAEIVYFESDTEGMLIEYSRRQKMPSPVTALGIAPVQKGRLRGFFAAVGCSDETVRLLSLAPGSTLETLSVQGISAPVSSVAISEINTEFSVHIGLDNGMYIVTSFDSVSGDLGDARSRFLGPYKVTIDRTWTSETNLQVVALCTKAWVHTSSTSGADLVPISYARLISAAPFSSADCPKGTVAVTDSSLVILQVDSKRENIHQRHIQLSKTPRKFITNSLTAYFYTLCTTKNQTSIEVVDAVKTDSVLSRTHIDGVMGLSICNCRFQSRSKEYLVLSTAKVVNLKPGTPVLYTDPCISIYEYSGSPFGTGLELVHSTSIPSVAHALVGYKGLLLAGTGDSVVLFDIGKKQLLRRGACVIKNSKDIRALAVTKDRIVVGDIKRSVTFVMVEKEVIDSIEEFKLLPFADEPIARSITSLTLLDYDTVAVGDRSGNLAILRCPKSVSNLSKDVIISKEQVANGCPYKLELLCHFYVGDIPIGLHRASFTTGGFEAIIWVGINGTIGGFIPIMSSQDAKFLQKLEQEMRSSKLSFKNLAGRDHLTYRGYYAPPKKAIDGDLCEEFRRLSKELQLQVSEALEREPHEIERKLIEYRTRSVF